MRKKSLEKWRPCESPYANYYEVSNRGNVRSLERVVDRGPKGKILKKSQPRKTFWNSSATPDNQRYMVTFNVPGLKPKTLYLHILVAQAFVKKPKNPNGDVMFVVFKDGITRNCNAWNLEWTATHPYRKSIIDKRMASTIRRLYQQGTPLAKIVEITGFTINTFAPIIYNKENNQYHNDNYKPKVGTLKRKSVSKKNKKLNKTQVREIRKIKGETYTAIAKRYNVGPDTISDVINKRTWTDVK
jgi:DNA-binding transcriptional regulator YiaG